MTLLQDLDSALYVFDLHSRNSVGMSDSDCIFIHSRKAQCNIHF